MNVVGGFLSSLGIQVFIFGDNLIVGCCRYWPASLLLYVGLELSMRRITIVCGSS